MSWKLISFDASISFAWRPKTWNNEVEKVKEDIKFSAVVHEALPEKKSATWNRRYVYIKKKAIG